jgi:peroxiredoxin
VAVSNDSQEDMDALRARHGLTFPMISDTALEIINGYGVREAGKGARPAVYVINRGPVVFARVGANAADRPTTEQILEGVRAGKAR